MKTIFISILIFANITLAQKSARFNESVNISSEKDFKEFSSSVKTSPVKNKFEKELKYRVEKLDFKLNNTGTKDNNSLNFLSNFGSNISFGGFYQSFAILNFTPQLNINPTGFIKIYANHYLNILIPLSRAREVSKSILINSISILALDNATSLFFKKNNWLAEIAEFTLKNCIINLLLKPELDNTSESDENIHRFDNYYYSISISF